MQLNNLELAVNLAKRANLPGAENLVSSITEMIYVGAIMLAILSWQVAVLMLIWLPSFFSATRV